MSENLIDGIAPHLAPPVTREPVGNATNTGAGVDQAIPGFPMTPVPPCFADDDAE